MRLPILAGVIGALSACGPASNLAKIENRAGVAQGGTDPSLLGTFRLSSHTSEGPDMLRLLVLRADRTFHAEYLATCPPGGCAAGTVSLDGIYSQRRELPDPTRAAGVALTGQYLDASGTQVPFSVTLNRAAIPDSPQTGLYHPSEAQTDSAPARPFFMLSHPIEAWCARQSDCEAQNLLDGSACARFACEQNTCVCH